MPAAELNVWLGEQHVATLLQTRSGELRLCYAEETVERLGEGAIAMSVALPVSTRRYQGTRVEYWAESLLPEGETRTTIEQRFGCVAGTPSGCWQRSVPTAPVRCRSSRSASPRGGMPVRLAEKLPVQTLERLEAALLEAQARVPQVEQTIVDTVRSRITRLLRGGSH